MFYMGVELRLSLWGKHQSEDKNWNLTDFYAANIGNFLPAFRDNLSVPSSSVKSPGVTTQKSTILIHFAAEG
jgi:hypothetical protein